MSYFFWGSDLLLQSVLRTLSQLSGSHPRNRWQSRRVVYPNDPAPTLDAFLRNFCSASATQSPDSGNLLCTTMIQPGVYFTLEAPFVRILGLYSNVLEDPGVIYSENGQNTAFDNRQIAFLTAALERVKTDKFKGAVIIAVHHPPFTGGSEHGGSPLMLAGIDSVCTAANVWPQAVFSGHAHNYQRYTRTVNSLQITVPGGGMRWALSAFGDARHRSDTVRD
jgi:hypothetical protein